jgi:tellurite resistance protein TehA-like permease
MEQIITFLLNLLSSVIGHPLFITTAGVAILVVIVNKGKDVDFKSFELNFLKMARGVASMLLLISTGILDWNEYKNIAPFLDYLKFYDNGKVVQIILGIGFISAVLLALLVHDYFKKQHKNKWLILPIVGIVVISQLSMLYYGWLAYIADYPAKPEIDKLLGWTRYITLIMQVFFNLLLNALSVIFTISADDVVQPNPNPIPPINMSKGGAISYTTYPF